MGIIEITIIIFLLLLLLLFSGIQIAFGIGILGLICLQYLLPTPQLSAAPPLIWEAATNYTLTAVPLFIFMGELFLRTGYSKDLFEGLGMLFSRLRGFMVYASIGACTLFAAASGSSVANAATIGTIAVPEMLNRGYKPSISIGSIAAGGTLGILIPPSITLIIYGSMAGQSVGQLFVAGIIPGILMSGLFFLSTYIWGKIRPEDLPIELTTTISWNQRFNKFFQLLPMAAIIIIVLGVIYFGIATPTESAGIGSCGALILAIIKRRINFKIFLDTVKGAATTTTYIMMIIISASILNYVMGYLRLPAQFTQMCIALKSPYSALALIYLLYLFLGMFIESISLIVLTVPVIYGAMQVLGFDLVWFGIVLVVVVEMGLITPPVGLNLYIMLGILDQKDLWVIIKGVMPFFICQVVTLSLITVFPNIVLWLPNHMIK